jgi:hypothetical protein
MGISYNMQNLHMHIKRYMHTHKVALKTTVENPYYIDELFLK